MTGDLIALGAGLVFFLVCLVVITIQSNRRRKWLEERLAKGHEWIAVPLGGPLEEGGMCKYCGAWATSECDTLCWPVQR